MPELGFFGWIIVGLLAGAISAWLMGGKNARGCLPNIVVGILGGVLGGYVAQQAGFDSTRGFFASLIVAVLGALLVRLVINLGSRD
jgi:uncharacterized membrane protein YeaQ/YmgE (transglycosylase-associated protein family)